VEHKVTLAPVEQMVLQVQQVLVEQMVLLVLVEHQDSAVLVEQMVLLVLQDPAVLEV
jgi:hypothetical protein